jgi:hypothetical protein
MHISISALEGGERLALSSSPLPSVKEPPVPVGKRMYESQS